MSITPVDKPPDGDDGSDTPRQRPSSLLKVYVGRFVSWLGERFATAGDGSDSQTRSQATGDPDKRGRTERTPAKAVNSPAFEDFPGRERPLTHPARDSPGINSPDVVSIETDAGLRLSVPENPDAMLTSDVWMTVEP